jgi:hypothetical protein
VKRNSTKVVRLKSFDQSGICSEKKNRRHLWRRRYRDASVITSVIRETMIGYRH